MSSSRRNKAVPGSGSGIDPTHAAVTLGLCIISFFAGTLTSMHYAISNLQDCTSRGSGALDGGNGDVEAIVNQRVHEALKLMQGDIDSFPAQQADPNARFPDTMTRYLNGMARMTKQSFMDTFDLGVPWDPPAEGVEDILLIYNRPGALPEAHTAEITGAGPLPLLTPDEAFANCDYLNVILNDNGHRHQCLAILPQYESFHIMKYMRVGETGALDSRKDLRMVSRGYQENGRQQFKPPLGKHTRKLWTMLGPYIENIDKILATLQPIAESCARVGKEPTVIVMVCNMGQSMLLMNFACAAKSRGLDLSQILVFATDVETKELAESLGMKSFYDHINFEAIPSEAASRYGDRQFVAMMMAKVICVQMISMLGYNILFQDVDIVWYKHPLEYFENNSSAGDFDVYFQDDGAHSQRYAPYSANSGFYYVKHNDRTQFFLTALLHAGDLIIKTDSHQQALIALLAEHVSLYGLKVKVLAKDKGEFPGGYHFHMKSGKYMHSLFTGAVKPYLFHMSWTLNKDNKLLFFQQMGEWWVNDICVGKKKNDITEEQNLSPLCCSKEPLFSCHYRDKASVKPCPDSPAIDKQHPSWWKKFEPGQHTIPATSNDEIDSK